MLFIILLACLVGNIILIYYLSDINRKYLGETSSLKIALKEKDKKIRKLKNKIQYIKNLNNDVEI